MNRFTAALQSAKANLARARAQEVALLSELHEELKPLHGQLSTHRYGLCPVPFTIFFEPEPEDCGPYLEITIRGDLDDGPNFGHISIDIGPSESQPYLLTFRNQPTPIPTSLDEALTHIADWVALNQEEHPEP